MGCINSKPAGEQGACVASQQAVIDPVIKPCATYAAQQPAKPITGGGAHDKQPSVAPDSVLPTIGGQQGSIQAASAAEVPAPCNTAVAATGASGAAVGTAVGDALAAPADAGAAAVDGAAGTDAPQPKAESLLAQAAAATAAAGAPEAQAAADVLPPSEAPEPDSADLTPNHSYTGAPAARQQSALAQGPRSSGGAPRTVKFADPAPECSSSDQNSVLGSSLSGTAPPPRPKGPRRSHSHIQSNMRAGEELNEAVLAKQVEILRSNKMGKLRQRRGGLDSSFAAMQEALAQDEKMVPHVNTRAAGLKHIGFGPFKRENQDEFFIQVGEFGGQHSSNLFCVFDGHGTYGKDAALYSRQLLPRLLDVELNKYFQRVTSDSDEGLKGAVEVLITEVFGETERSLAKFGVNLASSGTTASVAYQKGNRLWVASAGDSRAIMCSRNARDQWRALPLTIDHRPRRESERERIEAAGARVAPKRLPSGRTVGEPRLWLQNASGPGLLLSRSLGDLTAATVGCTSDPEVSFMTLRPNVDHVLVMATDGVWDVLTNEQVCDIVVESPDPHIACRRVLDAALYEWEERMSADNITVLVVEFDWAEDDSINSVEQAAGNRSEEVHLSDVDASVMTTAVTSATP